MEKEIKEVIDILKTQGTVPAADVKKNKTITISQLPGSGGREIADIIAKKMNLKVFEKTIITELAEFTGTDKEAFSIIADVTGDSKDFWLYRIFGGGEFSHETIRRHLTNIIQALASTGDAILMGRGTHIALKDIADIRVRIVAPKDVCIERLMEKMDCTKEEATEFFVTRSAASGKFAWSVFQSRLNDPTNFDLTINTEHIDNYETCADIIIDALKEIETTE